MTPPRAPLNYLSATYRNPQCEIIQSKHSDKGTLRFMITHAKFGGCILKTKKDIAILVVPLPMALVTNMYVLSAIPLDACSLFDLCRDEKLLTSIPPVFPCIYSIVLIPVIHEWLFLHKVAIGVWSYATDTVFLSHFSCNITEYFGKIG